MSAFTHGFNHGFFHGMFNGMFGGFGAFNWGCWNFRPSFFTPSFSFGNFFNYQSPMPMAPSVFSYNVPNFSAVNANIGLQNCNYAVPANMNMNWQTLNYSTPQFQYGFNGLGDSFIRTENPPKRKPTKNYSDTDTSNYTNDAETLKNKWSKVKPTLSQGFYNKVVQIANRLNCSADDLMALMNSESGLNHTEQNTIGATGLIQFMPKTAEGLGTSTEALMAMTPEEQLNYVEKHIKNAKKAAGYGDSERIGPGTLYALVWLPAYAKKDILARRDNDPNEYYAQNSGLDVDNDGIISKADLAQRIENKRA